MTSILKKSISTLFIVIGLISTIHAQSDKSRTDFKEITGYVSNNNSPLENVNITVVNSEKGVRSNKKGFYSIKAKKGEVIKFSYIGMKTVEVIVEDDTKTLNISMRVFYNKLDEVVLNEVVKMPTTYGKINPTKGSITYIKGEDLNLGIDLLTAIKYRTSPLRSSGSINLGNDFIWDIDGVIFLPRANDDDSNPGSYSNPGPPEIDISNVYDIAILRSLADLVPYGSLGRNGVIVVRTKNAYFDVNNPYAKHNPYTNKTHYNGDAGNIKELNSVEPKYMHNITANTTSFEALNTYNKLKGLHQNNINFYIDVANYFKHKYNNLKYYYKVLNDAKMVLSKNPEALKALAYTYQEQGTCQKAIAIYKKIIRLRPKYAQSFRDLANAYTDNKQYNEAWKIYMNYLYRGNKLGEKGIGLIMYNEMESLYAQKKDVNSIRETLVLKDPKNIKKDIRIIFEWSASEAEFALEFVNPQNQSYTFEHSFYANKNTIVDEKIKGYSSKEFFIDKLKKGNWLVNLTYYGNKRNTPIYLKTTVYTHWAAPNQTRKIRVFKLTNKNKKIQLLKFNSEIHNCLSIN